MAERDGTTGRQMSAIEKRRARSRARHARLRAADPNYHKKKYRRDVERNPNLNREKYKRALAKDPDFNKKKREKSRKKSIAANPDSNATKQTKAKPRKTQQERDREKYLRNKQKVIARVVRRQRERYATDPTYALCQRLRSRLRQALRAKRAPRLWRTMNLVGCSQPDLVRHIEANFLPGMSWENRHLWHVDHVIPISAFDISTDEGQRAAFHFTNLRPLWASDNHKKSWKVPVAQQRFGFGYVLLADKQCSRARLGAASRGRDENP